MSEGPAELTSQFVEDTEISLLNGCDNQMYQNQSS